ncbi:hypothetical protein B0T13DRAFT_476528 [Neurospora crassa]|nr:hypothetical protein B0T13DRAFT_476528 [Neurospora crassa]
MNLTEMLCVCMCVCVCVVALIVPWWSVGVMAASGHSNGCSQVPSVEYKFYVGAQQAHTTIPTGKLGIPSALP